MMQKPENTDHEFEMGCEIFSKTFQQCAHEGISRQVLLTLLLEITASFAADTAGEQALWACVSRLGDWINEFRSGRFPMRKELAS